MSSSSSTTRILGPSLTPYSYSQADRIPPAGADDPSVARILIVEPHADIRSLFEHVIRRAGHEPVLAEFNGTGPPDVDAAVIEPGDSHGLACARRLRQLGRPVVFASILPVAAGLGGTLGLIAVAVLLLSRGSETKHPLSVAPLTVSATATPVIVPHAPLQPPKPIVTRAVSAAARAHAAAVKLAARLPV